MPGQMNMLKETKIGEFLLQNDQNSTVQLPCYLPWDGTLSLDLLDSLGRSYLHKKLSLKAGQQELSISLPKLPVGHYNAWINFGDKTVIRRLTIQRNKPGRNFISRLLG